MEKEKWIIRLIFSDKFMIIATLMVTVPLRWYIGSYALLILTVAICLIVGLLLGRINRLKESIDELRREREKNESNRAEGDATP